MAKAAAEFDGVNEQLTTTLKQLMDKLSHLQTAWVGSGGRAFEHVKTQYHQDLTQLNKALADTAEAIRTSGRSYESADSSSASLITKSGGSGISLPLEN